MTKNHTEQTGSNLLAHPGRTSDSSPKNTVSKQMSLSDSILSGAVVSKGRLYIRSTLTY